MEMNCSSPVKLFSFSKNFAFSAKKDKKFLKGYNHLNNYKQKTTLNVFKKFKRLLCAPRKYKCTYYGIESTSQ